MSESPIERFYRCRISFETTSENCDRIVDYAFKYAPDNVDVGAFYGNPVCHPYVEAESQSLPNITFWRSKVIQYINRFSFSSTRIL